MAFVPPTITIIPERGNYDLELVAPSTSGAPYIVQAKPSASSTYRFLGSDAQFNISSKIGNDSGHFVWGRTGFEKNGQNFELYRGQTGRFLLTGSLTNPEGKLNNNEFIDLDEKLEVIEYVDQGSSETTHKLVERNPVPSKRTLVLCFDGTSNQFGKRNTNVVKFVELLKKTDPGRQMVYYQVTSNLGVIVQLVLDKFLKTGVGTYSPPGMLTTLGLKIAEKADEMAAWYLYQQVIDGYKFLMQSYRNGDSISIFGFSRGAFTARALAGMLHCVGLLPRHNAEHIPFAYEIYKNAGDYYDKPPPSPANTDTDEVVNEGTPLIAKPKAETPTTGSRPQDVNPEDFKKTFCIPVTIDFVGVWDTVASVGSLYPRTLPWIGYNPSITVFRHALALDERRGNFIPSVWDHRYTHGSQSSLEVWFRGEHTDIGGSDAPHDPNDSNGKSHSVLSALSRTALKCAKVLGFGSGPATDTKPDENRLLSNITLRWMVRQCLERDTGIVFDHTAMETYRKNGVLERSVRDYMSGHYLERMEASAMLDIADNARKIRDSIGRSVLWNTLEAMPIAKPTSKHVSEPNSNQAIKPEYTRWPNLKKGRSVYTRGFSVMLHNSVVEYMTSEEGKGYRPRATWHGDDSWMPAEDSYKGDGAIPDEVRVKLGMPKQAKQNGFTFDEAAYGNDNGFTQSGFAPYEPSASPEVNQS
ncbi:hypothetical protein BDV93DRAFT_547351 [Ceratobasidium sp. AG-I]|nr:hypothetical protein BDV93DRAFT_547351 [Ceratobasidium sp. AG-I]